MFYTICGAQSWSQGVVSLAQHQDTKEGGKRPHCQQSTNIKTHYLTCCISGLICA